MCGVGLRAHARSQTPRPQAGRECYADQKKNHNYEKQEIESNDVESQPYKFYIYSVSECLSKTYPMQSNIAEGRPERRKCNAAAPGTIHTTEQC